MRKPCANAMGWVEKDDEGNVTVHPPAANTRGPSPPKAYLDTNLVSGLGKADMNPDEYEALHRVIELMHEGRVAWSRQRSRKRRLTAYPWSIRLPIKLSTLS